MQFWVAKCPCIQVSANCKSLNLGDSSVTDKQKQGSEMIAHSILYSSN